MNNKPTPKTARKTPAAAPARKAAAPAESAKATAPVKPVKPSAKTTAEPAAKPAAKPVAEAVAASKPKHKLVRDSFTIPKAEYAVLDALKVRAAKLARPVKKSELLRAGISALNGMSDKAFLAAMNGVPSLKTGRPSGAKAAAPLAKPAK